MIIKAFLADLDDTMTYSWTNKEQYGLPMPHVLEVLERLHARAIPVRIITNQAGILWHHYQPEVARLHENWKLRDYPSAAELSVHLGKTMKYLGLKDIFVSIWDPRLLDLITPVEWTKPKDIWNPQPSEQIYFHRAPDDEFTTQKMEVAVSLATALQTFLTVDYDLNASASADPNWRKPKPGMILHACKNLGITDLSTVVYCGDMHNEKYNSDRLAAQNAGVRFLEAERITEVLDML